MIPLKFATSEELRFWLQERHVDLRTWGRGSAKSVANLWAEIEAGEAVLVDHPPLRLVHVVRVLICREDLLLIEAEQDLIGGRRRTRERPPSEKMRPGEDYLEAAYRCLCEELGLGPAQAQVLPHTYRRRVRDAPSASYPGLPARYTFHIVDAKVQGLPAEAFATHERAPGPGEPVSKHYWEWRPRYTEE